MSLKPYASGWAANAVSKSAQMYRVMVRTNVKMLVGGLAIGVAKVEDTSVVLRLRVNLGGVPSGRLVGAKWVGLATGGSGEARSDDDVRDRGRRNDAARVLLGVVAGERGGGDSRGGGEDGGEEELHLDK